MDSDPLEDPLGFAELAGARGEEGLGVDAELMASAHGGSDLGLAHGGELMQDFFLQGGEP